MGFNSVFKVLRNKYIEMHVQQNIKTPMLVLKKCNFKYSDLQEIDKSNNRAHVFKKKKTATCFSFKQAVIRLYKVLNMKYTIENSILISKIVALAHAQYIS